MRNNPTDAERAFWEMVSCDALGVSFRRQHIIGEYIADFVCLEKQLVVELDGGYHNDEQQQILDNQRTRTLNEFGFTVLRLSNEEVLHTPNAALNKIKKVLTLLPLQGGLRGAWTELADKLVYTGAIDEYFDYKLGKLDWRTVSFKTRVEDTPNYQGNAVVNYTSHDEPFTRVIEHKHFESFGQAVYDNPKTVVSEEYSAEYDPDGTLPLQGGPRGAEPYYPVNDDRNNTLADEYRKLAEQEVDVIFGGRLAQYKYYDMAPIIEQVLNLFA